MSVSTIQATVEHGQIRLPEGTQLPENATVYIVIPDVKPGYVPQLRSPRLTNPVQASHFKMTVTNEPN